MASSSSVTRRQTQPADAAGVRHDVQRAMRRDLHADARDFIQHSESAATLPFTAAGSTPPSARRAVAALEALSYASDAVVTKSAQRH